MTASPRSSRPADRGLVTPASLEEGFEALYRRLEETVLRLEDGNLPLDEAIDLYEHGMRLAKQCSDHLSTATLRIRQIQIDFGLDGLDDAAD